MPLVMLRPLMPLSLRYTFVVSLFGLLSALNFCRQYLSSREVLKLPVQCGILLLQKPLDDYLLHVVVQNLLCAMVSSTRSGETRSASKAPLSNARSLEESSAFPLEETIILCFLISFSDPVLFQRHPKSANLLYGAGKPHQPLSPTHWSALQSPRICRICGHCLSKWR